MDSDKRWPRQCAACDYRFLKNDPRQLAFDQIYERTLANGEKVDLTLDEPAAVGAMLDAWWAPDSWKGPDGIALMVILPPGGSGCEWIVDQERPGPGRGWQRTGTVPNVTVTPSIQTPRYHGFLTNGVLIATPDSPT